MSAGAARRTETVEAFQMAREAGANKIYFASASPPVRYPNVYGIDMPTRQELIATERDPDEICHEISADHLIFQDLDALTQAVSKANPALTRFETSCFNGNYITGTVTPEYLSTLEARRHTEHADNPLGSRTRLDLSLAVAE